MKKSWQHCPGDERIIVHPEWERVLENRMQALGVSRRKREILWHVLAGMSTEEIAKTLYIMPKTVKGHVSQVYDKLNLIPIGEGNHRTNMRTHLILFLLGIDMALLRDRLQSQKGDGR